jgi:hypothetical protein
LLSFLERFKNICNLWTTEKMSIFQLTLCLRLRYLVYSFLTYIGSSILFVYLAQTASWDMPGFAFFPQITFVQMIVGTNCLIAFYLQTKGIQNAKEYYNYNKVGKGRAARVLSRHRDVMQINTSWQTQWKSTKKYCFFYDVIPMNLVGLGLLLGIFIYLTQGMGILPFAVAIGFFLLSALSVNYADDHLCNPEMTELYERPQTYDSAITHGKQEIVERASMQRAKEQIEKERKRNLPLSPENDQQRRPPRKPY